MPTQRFNDFMGNLSGRFAEIQQRLGIGQGGQGGQGGQPPMDGMALAKIMRTGTPDERAAALQQMKGMTGQGGGKGLNIGRPQGQIGGGLASLRTGAAPQRSVSGGIASLPQAQNRGTTKL